MGEELLRPKGEIQFEMGMDTPEARIEALKKLNECYEGILQVLKDYIDTTEENYKLIALWVIGTYFHEKFYTYPYLFFNAMRGSGKTRTLKLISSLGANGDGSVQNNLTEAVLFRIPRGTTTCIDEVEQIGNKEKQTLRELLNSAYKKGMKVKRMKKVRINGEDKQVCEVFEPYFPIAMANIWGVEEVLADRSIVLILEKSNNAGITMKVEDFDRNDMILQLKRTLRAVSVVSVMSLAEKDYIGGWNAYVSKRYNDIYTLPTLTTLNNTNNTITLQEEITKDEFFNKIHDLQITGRNLELSFPLLIIAKMIDEKVFEEISAILSKFVLIKKEDEYLNSKDVAVFDFVLTQQIEGLNYLSLKELTEKFRIFLGEGESEDRWLNEKWFGRALKRLNLVLDKKRLASGRLVILNYAKAKEKLKMFKGEEK